MNTDKSKPRVIQRIYARGIWKASSAIHLGAGKGKGGRADQVLVRTPEGGFYIPASSLTGAIRSALAARQGSYQDFRKNLEEREVRVLFGRNRGPKKEGSGDEKFFASLVTIDDAHAVKKAAAQVRDGVAIDAKFGTAKDRAKFDLEVLPAGTEFSLSLSVTIYDQLPEGLTADELRSSFGAALELLRGKVRLGARTRRGYGEGAVENWSIFELNMDDRAHLAAWLRRKPEQGAPKELKSIEKPEGRGAPWFEISASLALDTSLLIRSAGDQPSDPDSLHLTEQGRALLTGTSLAGALRHRVERIAKTIIPEEAAPITEGMFGPLLGGKETPEGRKRKARGGRVWVSECEVKNCTQNVQGRVAIDRFTGGARDTALFDEAPSWPVGVGVHVEVSIRLEDPHEAEVGLLIAAFKDLWLGDLTLGGGAGVGRGVFRGITAKLSTPDGKTWRMDAIGGDPARIQLSGGSAAALNEYMKSLTTDAPKWQMRPWEKPKEKKA
jgi:CRISPR/Cas system CSM-associated protein Csm3 (group 7 of RAMP superfamily)